MRTILVILCAVGGLMAQKQQIGLTRQTGGKAEGGRQVRPAVIPLTVTKHERHIVIESENDGRDVLYRHDLTKPSVTLVSKERHGDEWLYVYRISNEKTALEPINRIVFRDALPMAFYYSHAGVRPGNAELWSVTSRWAPGPTTMTVLNTDQVRESAYLDQFGHRSASGAFAISRSALDLHNYLEVDVVGPAIPPEPKQEK